jgi:outer membrane protein assembly factor BamB
MRRSASWEGLAFLMVCLLGLGTAAMGEDTSYWCIDKDLLDHAGLTIAWQDTLPIKDGERIKVMTVLNDRLYVRSDRNYVWSINRDDGTIIFSVSVAPRGLPILGWTAYENRLICVIDNQLVQLDINSGLRRWTNDPGVSVMTPPVRNSRFFYIGATDRRLHAFQPDDVAQPGQSAAENGSTIVGAYEPHRLVELFEAAAENDSLVTTIVADENLVVFGTDAGNLLALTADGPRKLWEFKAVEAISGPVIRDGSSFFFASRDTNVYRVDMVEPTRVVMAWRHQMEGILDRAPRVTKDAVYQYAPGRGLTAVDRQTGRTLWSLPEGIDLAAQAGAQAYVTTRTNTLTIMDNAAGRELSAVNMASVVDHASNTADAKIYIADARGRVACLVSND